MRTEKLVGFPARFPTGIPEKWGKLFAKISHFRKKMSPKILHFFAIRKMQTVFVRYKP